MLKDNDLTQKLRLHEEDSQKLYRQLKMDSDLLCNFGIMDYSLLMGVHDVEYVVGDDFEEPVPKQLDSNEPETQVNPFDASSVMDAPTFKQSPLRNPNLAHLGTPSGGSGKSGSRHGSNASGRKLPRSGMRLANSVVGPAYYHLGVIDILQTWTLKKRTERFFKIHFKRVDGDGLSAIEPNLYKERFQAKMRDILGIEQEEEDTLSEHAFLQQTTHMDIEPSASQNPIQLVRSLTSSSHLITSLDYQRPSSSRSSRSRHAAL